MIETQNTFEIGFTRRDVVCFSVALVLHLLLFLWKGGMLQLPDNQNNLGDMLVEVGYIADYQPSPGPASGSEGKSVKKFFSDVKNFFTKSSHEEPAAPEPELAVGKTHEPVPVTPPAWKKVGDTLRNREFSAAKFSKESTSDAPLVAQGQGAENNKIQVAAQQSNFPKSGPALKGKSFKVATKDMPFQISQPQNVDMLANVNAIPIAVGQETTKSVKKLGSDAAGPSLQNKSFASGAPRSARGFGGGTTGSQETSGGEMLAMGGAGGSIADSGSESNGDAGTAGAGGGGGQGQGIGSGSGQSSRSGAGQGRGDRAWSSRGGFGKSQMEDLPRRTAPLESNVQTPQQNMSEAGDKDFLITGDLAGRGIVSKVKPSYENLDGRVALQFRVDWRGKVLPGILVIISSGNPSFDQRVMAALKNWVFVKLSNDHANEVQKGVITFIFKGV